MATVTGTQGVKESRLETGGFSLFNVVHFILLKVSHVQLLVSHVRLDIQRTSAFQNFPSSFFK